VKVLVTGGSGFIGGALVRRLAGSHDVYATTRGVTDDVPGVRWIAQDLSRPLEGLPRSVDMIVHLAQSRRYREFPEEALDVFNVNTRSTVELLDYARRASASHFVLASTGGVYGNSETTLSETDRPAPADFYSTTKYAAELATAAFADYFATTILRFFFVYGESQQAMLIPTLAARILRGEVVRVQGSEGLAINPIYISDAVDALVRVLEQRPLGVINVAGMEVVTIRDIAAILARLTGRVLRIEADQSLPDRRLVASTERLRSDLGVSPDVALDEGLRRVVEALTS
jgi:UDP-glucose 4-epimerase